MISTSQHTSPETQDVENDLEKEKHNQLQESQDDWVVNDSDNVNENDINIIVPSFIRLFVIKRIIDKYIKNNKDKKKDKKEIIKEMANVFKENKKIESLAIKILTRLINDGIKKYMSKYYDEKKQAYIIEDIFNKLILKKFKKEYYQLIAYEANNERNDSYNYYQNLVFNSSDLMNQIFQYLKWGHNFDDDLYSCSLVSGHWLYHVWNPNSVYHVDFSNLLQNYNNDNNRKWRRIWQRLYNVKYVEINFDLEDNKAAVAAVNKLWRARLFMFRTVEKVHIFVDGKEVIKFISPIMSRCKDKIKYCQIHIDEYFDSYFKAPSPLMLPKAQYVEVGDLDFYRIWTNECTQLKLCWLSDISKDWCKFVIANCDCSNINSLTLYEMTFDNSINKMILKQFAVKFYNLKTLKIVLYRKVDDNVLLFWQLLKPIILKNKTKVQLVVEYLFHVEAISSLSPRMDQKGLKIDKLIIGDGHSRKNVDDAIRLIQERDNHGLRHVAIEQQLSDERKNFLDELKCKSITTFELKNKNINFVNSLLEWKMITQKKIFVIIDVYGYHDTYRGDEGLSLFKQLYKNVYQLFVQQVGFDIKITFKTVKESKVFESYLSIYSSYFENSEFLSKYNSPNRNSNLCLPRDKPYTYFYIHDSKNGKFQRYFVFGATNVQIK